MPNHIAYWDLAWGAEYACNFFNEVKTPINNKQASKFNGAGSFFPLWAVWLTITMLNYQCLWKGGTQGTKGCLRPPSLYICNITLPVKLFLIL